MHLKKIALLNFKNISQEELALCPGINCLVGDNGAGKTNVVDAVYYLSMCKSSLPMTDGQSIRHGADFFLVEGTYASDAGKRETIVCSFSRKGGKVLKRNGKGYIMGPINDPEAAAYIHDNHKVGDRISIKIGGKVDPINGEPIELQDAEVVNLSDGKLISAAPINFGVAMDYGKSVRLRQSNVEIIIVSIRFQTYDDRPFIMTGCDMSQYRIVGLKSMNHFRGYFRNTADAIVTADPPGQCPMDLKLYPYQYVCRPILPLDSDVTYNKKWPVTE